MKKFISITLISLISFNAMAAFPTTVTEANTQVSINNQKILTLQTFQAKELKILQNELAKAEKKSKAQNTAKGVRNFAIGSTVVLGLMATSHIWISYIRNRLHLEKLEWFEEAFLAIVKFISRPLAIGSAVTVGAAQGAIILNKNDVEKLKAEVTNLEMNLNSQLSKLNTENELICDRFPEVQACEK